MFLWITPRPPHLAKAMAMADSVTVSIGELSMGIFSLIRWVRSCGHIHLRRNHLAVGRKQQDIIKSDGRMGNFVVHGVSHGSIRGQEITISIYVIGVPVTASNWTLSPRGASGKAVSGARWRLTDWSLLPIRIPISLTPARAQRVRSVSRWPLWRTERRSWYAACRFPHAVRQRGYVC